jgi:hypothetical protein
MATFTCHHCGNVFNTTQRRKGSCRFCYGTKVSYCRDCAWWELGPLPAMSNLPDELRTSPSQSKGLVSRCMGKPPRTVDPHGTDLISDMRNACGLFDYQMAYGGFDADHQAGGPTHGHGYDADDGYDYTNVPAQRDSDPELNVPEPVRAPGLLSGNVLSETPTIIPFSRLATAAVDKYDELYRRRESNPEAIAYNRMMRTLILIYFSAQERCGYINDICVHRHDAPRIAAKHLAICFSGGSPVFVPPADRQTSGKALELMVIEQLLKDKISLANAYFMLRKIVSDDAEGLEIIKMNLIILHVFMAVKPLDVIPNGTNFGPQNAHGYLTADIKGKILQENGTQFRDDAKKKIASLYSCFQHGAAFPAGGRIRFADANINGLGTIQQEHKNYLQSMPKMDHTGVALANVSPCEKAVRSRIITRLKKIASQCTVEPAYQNVGEPFENFEQCKNDDDLSTLLDTIIEDMNSGKFWVETTSWDPLFSQYYISSTNRANFCVLNQYQTARRDINWQHVFPDCANTPNATAPGTRHLPHMLAYVRDGRQNAKQWYMDWRNDKDQYLYDCFNFTVDERPTFANYSALCRAPEPNYQYGRHQIVWNSNVLDRSVISPGDKGVAYRSKLLLLQDLLCRVPLATGEYIADEDKAKLLQEILQGLLSHGYIDRWDVLDLTGNVDSNQRVIRQPIHTRGTITLFECHIFGDMLLERDAFALTLSKGGMDPGHADGANPAWIDTIRGYGAGYHVTVFRSDPLSQVPRHQQIPGVLTSNRHITQVNRKVP